MDELLASVTRAAWAQCWQVTALIAIVGVVLRFVGRNQPHLASVLWLVVFVKCITPPVVSCPWGVFCWLQQIESRSPSVPAIDARLSSSEQTERLDSHVDTAVARLSSPDAEEWTFDREPRSESLDASGERVMRWSFSARTVFIGSIAAGWMAGCVLFVSVTFARAWSCWRKLTLAGEIKAPDVLTLLEGIRQRLELRRSVKLWVTPSVIGPAVIGIWRPTIILPAALVGGNSQAALEPLLAHELMHIRRGDLWTGLLQTLAVGLWWFHPLVWLASRLLTRDTEQCCDEQVIAHLRCDPRMYARSLVDVLALKQQLQPVPVCPGVRPIDVTSQRLERIMRLGQGCHKRTPWWCWVAMLTLALAALPGAALLARRQAPPTTPPSNAPWANLQISASELLRLHRESSAATSQGPAEELTTRELEVSDLLSEIEEHYVESGDSERDFLIHLLRYFVHGPKESGEGLDVDPSRPSITWSGDKLVVRHTQQGHDWIERQLTVLREHGYAQLCVEVRVLSGPAALLSAAGADWQLIGGTTPEADASGDTYPGGQNMPVPPQGNSNDAGISGTVQSVIERQLPAMMALVNDAQVKKLIVGAQNHPTTNIIFAPNITVFNGHSARIEDCTERPFVVGVKPVGEGKFEPQIRVVTEGTTIRLRPELHRDKRVHLDVGVTLSSVKDVETAQFALGPGKDPIAVQVPEVSTMRVQSSVVMELDQSLAISIPATKSDKKGQPSCILVRVHCIEEPFISSKAAPATGDAEEVSKKPARPQFAAGKIVAKVGDKVILYEEISPTVELILHPLLAKAKTEVECQAIEAQRERLTRNVIQQTVQNKRLLIEFERAMPNELRNDPKKRAEFEAKQRMQINTAFESSLRNAREKVATASPDDINKMLRSDPMVVRLALLMKERRLESPEELDSALREFGTTLEQQVKNFGEYMLGLEAARTAVNEKRVIPEVELLDYYQEHLADYSIPSQARFEILTASYARFNADRNATRDYAAKMRDEVQAGKPFAEVARRLSQEPRAEEGGFYDWLSPGSLASQPIDHAVFTLDVNQLSSIIEDEYGCHVMRVIERRDSRQMLFAEVSSAIQKAIEARNQKEDQQAFLDSMRTRIKVWTIYDE